MADCGASLMVGDIRGGGSEMTRQKGGGEGCSRPSRMGVFVQGNDRKAKDI